jgi:hypothetical protein
MENADVPVSARPMVALELAVRGILKKGVKDCGYARNLVGFTSKETIYANTGMSHHEAFTTAWNKVLAKARMETFHRCIQTIFGVSIKGIRGMGTKAIKFLEAAERSLEQVPVLEISRKNQATEFYEPTPTKWIEDNIDPRQATAEKWNQFKQLFQTELLKYTNLRTSRLEFANILEEEDMF